jgi:hypothetical protein
VGTSNLAQFYALTCEDLETPSEPRTEVRFHTLDTIMVTVNHLEGLVSAVLKIFQKDGQCSK